MIRVAIPNALGRVAKELVTLVQQSADFKLEQASVRPSNPALGTKVLGCELLYEDNACLGKSKQTIDVIIDFSLQEGVLQNAQLACDAKIPLVLGSTNIPDDLAQQLKDFAQQIPICYSPNMSVGINSILPLVTALAAKLPEYFSVAIHEEHHVHKKDAPSGTALLLQERLSDYFEKIPITANRTHETVGEHHITFATDNEVIKISHYALDRKIFAQGALQAARKLITMPPGWYSFNDLG